MADGLRLARRASVRTERAATLCEGVPWTDDDLVRLHRRLLHKSLRALFDSRVCAATRVEILDWLLSPKDCSNAFSYHACCALSGLDPEVIRDRVLKRYWSRDSQ
jgi:hypothetical protein